MQAAQAQPATGKGPRAGLGLGLGLGATTAAAASEALNLLNTWPPPAEAAPHTPPPGLIATYGYVVMQNGKDTHEMQGEGTRFKSKIK